MNKPQAQWQQVLQDWKLAGVIILCIRFVQGFIFWGGGSRRFIYAPQKLDPHDAQWMANKLQGAMPGALLDTGHLISYLLQHFYLLYAAIILFSLVELVAGAALVLGFFTRAAGLVTALISISLMLIFGWEGSTCLDEWTMAVSNLSMGLTLALAGSSAYSIDGWLIRRHPSLLNRAWFLTLASGTWTYKRLKRTAMLYAIFTIVFTLSTYDYYRGAIYSPYHTGPVSAVVHHIALSEGKLKTDGGVTFTAYVDAGNAAIASYVMRIALVKADGSPVESWKTETLGKLPAADITNVYLYNRITTGPYGLIAPVGSKAGIRLPPVQRLQAGDYQLQVDIIQGNRFILPLHLALTNKKIERKKQ